MEPNNPESSPPNRQPECVVLAGPNGAGKSSIYALLRFEGEFVNADDIARQLEPDNPDAAAIKAGRRAIQRLEWLIGSRSDFVYETTLSSHQSIRLLRVAREAGYAVLLVFIALQSADLHVLRVKQRVLQGGHAIPETSVRRRYHKTFDQLQRAIPFCHAVEVYDNSGPEGPRLVVSLREGRVVDAAFRDNALDRGIASSLRRAGLDVPNKP